MQEKSQEDQIDEILDSLVGVPNVLDPPTLLGSFIPRLDVSRPNIHDTKKEFAKEKSAVEGVVDHLDAVIKHLLGDKDDEGHSEMVARLRVAIDTDAVKSTRGRPLQSARDLALKNILETGFYYNSLFVVLETLNVYRDRLKELRDQEVEFWSVPNRPPNYYARTIALRLARLYAKKKRQKPTFGISREGSHPSTEFGRALEQMFSILGIKASVRNAAVWALDQLSEDDINPPVNAFRGGLLGLAGLPPSKPQENTRDAIVKALSKGTE